MCSRERRGIQPNAALTDEDLRVTKAARGRVLLIDMGGTIGEGTPRDRRGRGQLCAGASARFLSAARVSALQRIAHFDYVCFNDKASPDLSPLLWMDLAKTIDEHKARYEGFVVTHGTDTLAWAAATLSFALWGFTGSVIVTGAMRPLTRRGSDGWPNLVHSFRIASQRLVPSVSVVFGARILHGCRVRKVACRSTEAFDAPAVAPLGRIGKTIRLTRPAVRPRRVPRLLDENRRFLLDRDVAFVAVSPNLAHTTLEQLGWARGVVVETYPSGTIPRRLFPALEALAADRPVVISVENGRLMAPTWPRYPAFLTSARDMTREGAVMKLMWALAQSSDRKSLQRLMMSNVVGEISTDA